MGRITWVDNAKAIAIYLVVLGHFHYAYAPLPFKEAIYAFHIPAFLFITGFLLPESFPEMPPGRFFSRYVALYLRAYAFFSAIAIAIWWAGECAGARGLVSPWPAILGALGGVQGRGAGLVHQDAPLWYFPFLVTSMIAAYVAVRLRPPLMGLGFAALAAAFGFLWTSGVFSGGATPSRLPWGLDIAGVGAGFILAGHLARRAWPRIAPWLEGGPGVRGRLALGAILALGALVLVTRANTAVNINGADLGAGPVLFYLGAFAGIALLVLVAAALPPSRIAERISRETLTIFALHIYLVLVFGKLPHPGPGAWGVIGAMVSAALAVIVCLGLARVLRPALDRLVTR